MTITTEPVVPDDASELIEEPMPIMELITRGTGKRANRVEVEFLDPDDIIPPKINREGLEGEPAEFTDEELSDLLSSVPIVGFLQPAVVIPHPTLEGKYEGLVGMRRRAAASRMGRELPTIVVRSADQAQQILTILFENEHRLGLRPTQKAKLYQQLTLLPGWTEAKIAKAEGVKTAQVKATLALVELPPTARQAADTGQLDLGLAADLAEFSDDPKLLAKIIDKGNSTWGFQHAISDARQRKARNGAADRLFAELTMAGVKITTKPKDFGYASREVSIDRLTDAGGDKLDPMVVRTKPGFAAYIDKQAYGDPKAVIYCLDPEKYGYTRTGYTSYVSEADRRQREQQEADAEALRDALAAAESVRWTFLKAFYGNPKSAKAHQQPALRDAMARPGAIEYDGDYDELADAIAGGSIASQAPKAGPDRLVRMLVARWITAQEENLAQIIGGQRYNIDRDAARIYLDRLVAGGYELSEAESQVHAALAPQQADSDADGEAADAEPAVEQPGESDDEEDLDSEDA